MRILGIDPGLRTTGFGVVESEGNRLRYIASGTIKTDAVDIGHLPARLKIIFEGVREVTTRYQPTCASVEIVFVNVNPQSTLLLGQARGAALTALVAGALDVSEYTALQCACGDVAADVAGGGDECNLRMNLQGLRNHDSYVYRQKKSNAQKAACFTLSWRRMSCSVIDSITRSTASCARSNTPPRTRVMLRPTSQAGFGSLR